MKVTYKLALDREENKNVFVLDREEIVHALKFNILE